MYVVDRAHPTRSATETTLLDTLLTFQLTLYLNQDPVTDNALCLSNNKQDYISLWSEASGRNRQSQTHCQSLMDTFPGANSAPYVNRIGYLTVITHALASDLLQQRGESWDLKPKGCIPRDGTNLPQ